MSCMEVCSDCLIIGTRKSRGLSFPLGISTSSLAAGTGSNVSSINIPEQVQHFPWICFVLCRFQFLALKSQKMVFKRPKSFWRQWDAVKIVCVVRIVVIGHWALQITGSFNSTCNSCHLSASVPSARTSPKRVFGTLQDGWDWSPLYNILKGFFFQ